MPSSYSTGGPCVRRSPCTWSIPGSNPTIFSQIFFLRVMRVGYGQVKRHEGLRVSIRVSLVIKQKFHLRILLCQASF